MTHRNTADRDTADCDRAIDHLALVIGNSRLHWAWLQMRAASLGGDRPGHWQIRHTWDTPHLDTPITAPSQLPLPSGLSELQARLQDSCGVPPDHWRRAADGEPPLLLWIASVVPAQTQRVAAYPGARVLTLEHIPLTGLYPTLGIDRALALLGAGTRWGFPSLVIDAGTALTVTGVNPDRQLVGGAILPGLALQLKALAQHTATLPSVLPPASLPPRWAQDTETAITSGVIYGILATLQTFITAWQQAFPQSSLCLTGGDAAHLWSYLQADNPAIAAQVIPDTLLSFYGILALLP
ncbi:pantothenate kinase [Trichothermofontia sp.]